MAGYRKKWELKLQSYRENGIVPYQEANEDGDQIIIITEEQPNGGINSKYFDELIRRVILGEESQGEN